MNRYYLKIAKRNIIARYQQRIKDAYKELAKGMNSVEIVHDLIKEAEREKRRNTNNNGS